jgi:hypothetical protein
VEVVGQVVGEPGEILDPAEARKRWERWTRMVSAVALPEETVLTWTPRPEEKLPSTTRLELRVV